MNRVKLTIKTFIDGINDPYFYDINNPIEITEYTFNSARMSIPSLSAKLSFPVCLDNYWTGEQYIIFKGEMYFIKDIPSSLKDNIDHRYQHEITFSSEREILNNVYFYDAVTEGIDKYFTDNTNVLFFGDIKEAVARLNASLIYSGIKYRAKLAEGVETETKEINITDAFFSNALKTYFETYEIPYYFEGYDIIFGFPDGAITHPFEYGFDNELLSISKQNAGYKIVNKITGVGSTDNLPFRYPNLLESDNMKMQYNLMPSVYRESSGVNKFYTTQDDPDFNYDNPFTRNNPLEQLVRYDDIKPTIKGTQNQLGLPIDEAVQFFYVDGDSDEFEEGDSEIDYKYPHFFMKINKTDGQYGFNLFDSAIATGEMTISMTSGNCAGCNFKVQVVQDETEENKFYNPIKYVNGKPTIVESGKNDWDANQQDTSKNEVTLVLTKDIDTFNVIMPNAEHNYKPQSGDKFVILYIELPHEYVLQAERRLDTALIEYMRENNSHKFNFKIKFSRVFFGEHPEILEQLNDNSIIQIKYDEKYYELYISTLKYSVSNDSILPDIEVDLVDTITVTQGGLKKTIETIAGDILDKTGSGDFFKQGLKYFIRKDKDDIARGNYNFIKDITVGGNIDINKDITVGGNADISNGMTIGGRSYFGDLALFNDSLVSKDFISGFPNGYGWAILKDIYENIFGIKEDVYSIELDEITVRKAMRIYELIMSQLSGDNGTRLTTDMMKVLSIDIENKIIYLDTEKGILYNPFQKGDILMVQQYGGTPNINGEYSLIKNYELIVENIGIGSQTGENRIDWIEYDIFIGNEEDVSPRDILTRIDSNANPNRKGLIKHTSIEANSPYIDVIYGMRSDPNNATRVRMGKLSGIIDYWWGRLNGFGIYSDNVYLKGDFMLRTGDNIQTMFEVIEGRLRSAMQSERYADTEKDNFFTNATFTKEMEGWEHINDVNFFHINYDLINIGNKLLSEKNKIANITEYDGRQILRIKNSGIKQINSYISIPEVDSILYLTFRYKCMYDGILKIGFNGTDSNNFKIKEENIITNDDFKVFEISGEWDGLGDFILEFTGDIYIDHLMLSNKPLDDYKRKVSTLFEQTDEYIKLVAKETNEKINVVETEIIEINGGIDTINSNINSINTNIDNINTEVSNVVLSVTTVSEELNSKINVLSNVISITSEHVLTHENKITDINGEIIIINKTVEQNKSDLQVTNNKISGITTRIDGIDNTIETAGWITEADGVKLFATKALENGDELISRINVAPRQILIEGDKIDLTGAVSINNNVLIDTEGRIHANGAYISGTIRSNNSGRSIIIDSEDRSIILMTELGGIVGRWDFYETSSQIFLQRGNGTSWASLDSNMLRIVEPKKDGYYTSQVSLSTMRLSFLPTSGSATGKVEIGVSSDNKYAEINLWGVRVIDNNNNFTGAIKNGNVFCDINGNLKLKA